LNFTCCRKATKNPNIVSIYTLSVTKDIIYVTIVTAHETKSGSSADPGGHEGADLPNVTRVRSIRAKKAALTAVDVATHRGRPVDRRSASHGPPVTARDPNRPAEPGADSAIRLKCC
jgi:hypothetical protein